MTSPIFPCIWLKDNAKELAEFYCSIFPNSKITSENPVVVKFDLNGAEFLALNGNTNHPLNESVSFVITCADQTEIDYYWEKLTKAGAENMCGWCKDKFGVSWQIVPQNMGELLFNPASGGRAMQAMMKMKKILIDDLKNA